MLLIRQQGKKDGVGIVGTQQLVSGEVERDPRVGRQEALSADVDVALVENLQCCIIFAINMLLLVFLFTAVDLLPKMDLNTTDFLAAARPL